MHDDTTFTPAAGRTEWTPFYDFAIALLTRERRWRGALLRQAAPAPGDRILDVGCGTGTFAVMLKRAELRARVVGLDPDADVLTRARAKAAKADADVAFQRGFARDADADAGAEPFTKVVSSLVFHQVSMEEKRAGLASMWRALGPGGTLHVADYGLQRTPLMRAAFRQIQKLDGFDNTEPNARGVLPELMREVGFTAVEETEVVRTVTGSISLYRALRADA